MSNTILVGNLSTSVDEGRIKDLFSQIACNIVSITIPKDPKTGNCRGYALVEVGSSVELEEAIKKLDGQDIAGRAVCLTLESAIIKKRKWFQFGTP